jgi:hypothetical protein
MMRLFVVATGKTENCKLLGVTPFDGMEICRTNQVFHCI